MPTTLTAPIHAKKPFTVRFSNDNESAGTVLVVAGWVPKHQHSKPNAQGFAVAPSASDEFSDKVPSFADVRRLSITVSLDDGEFGLLEVFEDDEEHTSETVTETTTFEIPVDP